jgi:hypothetical protein
MSDNPLRALFDAHQGRLVNKWLHYFDVYHRHLQRFRGQPITLVEIGVFHGGSLQLWRQYLGPQARIIGVDINPECAKIQEPGCEILIGSQSDRGFLRQLRAHCGRIDVLIDDGGHRMDHLMISFQELFPAIDALGVYIAEDLHTCYWREYGGGYRNPYSFIEYAKQHIDQLNARYSRDAGSFAIDGFTRSAASMHFYDSMLVVEKAPASVPQQMVRGTPSYADPNIDAMQRFNSTYNAHLLDQDKAGS